MGQELQVPSTGLFLKIQFLHLNELLQEEMKGRPVVLRNSAYTRKQEIRSSVTSVWDGGIVYVLILHIRKPEMIRFSLFVLTTSLNN